jgi:hypothetical protein
MVKIFKKIWKRLDNNKSIIGLVLLLAINRVPGLKEWVGDDLILVQSIIEGLTGLSILHHIKKETSKSSKK